MAWIESHQSLAQHPKLLRLSMALGVSRAQALGHLHLLWYWAVDYAIDGDLSHFEDCELSFAAGYEGDPAEFAESMKMTGWIDTDNKIHDWFDYAGKLLYAREKDRKRKAARTNSSGIPSEFRRKAAGIQRNSDGMPPDSSVQESTVENSTVHNITQHTQERENREKPAPEVSDSLVKATEPILGLMSEAKLADLLNHYPEDWIRLAASRCVDRGKTGAAYLRGILQSWKKQGGPDSDKPNSRNNRQDQVPGWIARESGKFDDMD